MKHRSMVFRGWGNEKGWLKREAQGTFHGNGTVLYSPGVVDCMHLPKLREMHNTHHKEWTLIYAHWKQNQTEC